MKIMLRCLALTLALCCALAAFGAAVAEEDEKAYARGGIPVSVAVEEIGQFPVEPADTEMKITDWGEYTQGLMKSMMYTRSSAVTALNGGFFVVDGGGEDINRVGLFDENGQQLIPFEAALIRRLTNGSGEPTGRYLTVYYATEKTEDRNKALLYLSDGFFIGQGSPGEGDVMYEGYARFYDLEKKQFVGDLEAWESNASVGPLLVLSKGWDHKTYDPDGNLVSEELTAGQGYLYRNRKPYEIYDEELNLRSTTELQLSSAQNTGGYLAQYVPDQGYRITDLDGNVALEGPYKSVAHIKYGIVHAQEAGGDYVLMNTEGRELARSGRQFFCLCAGYYYAEENGKFTLVGPDGVIADDLPCRPRANLQVFDKESGKDARTMVLSSGEWALPFERGWDLGIGLVGVFSDESRLYGVYELFTGKQLLDFQFDKVRESDGLIYAYSGDTCHVYRARYEYR